MPQGHRLTRVEVGCHNESVLCRREPWGRTRCRGHPGRSPLPPPGRPGGESETGSREDLQSFYFEGFRAEADGPACPSRVKGEHRSGCESVAPLRANCGGHGCRLWTGRTLPQSIFDRRIRAHFEFWCCGLRVAAGTPFRPGPVRVIHLCLVQSLGPARTHTAVGPRSLRGALFRDRNQGPESRPRFRVPMPGSLLWGPWHRRPLCDPEIGPGFRAPRCSPQFGLTHNLRHGPP